MSYILDALRRADAERSRRAAPDASDLASQVVTTPPSPDTNIPSPARRPSIPWLLAGLLVVSVALVIGWRIGGQTQTPGGERETTLATAQVAPDTAPVPTAIAEPAQASAAAPAPAPAAINEPPPPVLRPEPGIDEPLAPVASPLSAAATAPVEQPAQENAPSPAAPVRPAIAGQDPPVKITGSTYSDNPAHRMLIANGKVVQEGQEIEPGMTLEVITPHSAVINHRGSRFNVNY